MAVGQEWALEPGRVWKSELVLLQFEYCTPMLGLTATLVPYHNQSMLCKKKRLRPLDAE